MSILVSWAENSAYTPALGYNISNGEITTLSKSVFCESKDDQKIKDRIKPEGTKNLYILANAPSPFTVIQNEVKTAKFVIDTKNHTLYEYNKDGVPTCAYLVATGKKSTPTHKGVRVVSHTETFPYKNAPSNTVRYNNPKAFGPKIIILNTINTKTGELGDNGEYIHGNNNINSLGTNASGGCVRMDNEVIEKLSGLVKRGDVVIIE